MRMRDEDCTWQSLNSCIGSLATRRLLGGGESSVCQWNLGNRRMCGSEPMRDMSCMQWMRRCVWGCDMNLLGSRLRSQKVEYSAV